jgi:ATP synthase F1 gamma subunit
MKMVAAAKLKAAQTRVDPAVKFNDGTAKAFAGLVADDAEAADYAAEQVPPKGGSKHLVVIVTTDRGLCGAVTSNVTRRGIEEIRVQKFKEGDYVVASIGTKGQDAVVGQGKAAALGLVAAELSVKPPTFTEVAYLADALLAQKPKSITVVYNHFVNLLTNKLVVQRLLALPQLKAATKWKETEFDDEDSFESLAEFQFASLLYAAVLDNATVEQATRMTAMEAAASNAAELVKGLTLKYNKTRQAVITTELSEIVSGMAAILGSGSK